MLNAITDMITMLNLETFDISVNPASEWEVSGLTPACTTCKPLDSHLNLEYNVFSGLLMCLAEHACKSRHSR